MQKNGIFEEINLACNHPAIIGNTVAKITGTTT